MAELDGIWEVERVSGLLPPLHGVRKRISGSRGQTTAIGVRAPFDIVGRELRYRAPLSGFVDQVEPSPAGGWDGRALLHGREYGRFRLVAVREARLGSIHDQLVKHLDEAIAMEENVARMLDAMIDGTGDAEVLALLERHKAETVLQSQRLRQRLDANGAAPSLAREAVAIIGAFAKLPFDLVRGEQAARDAYVAEHLEIATYQLLERVAVRAGDEETAAVARQNRAEEEEMARRLDELWDRFVELSLRDEGIAV